MDVRGPTDSHNANGNKLPHVNQIRIESGSEVRPKASSFTTSSAESEVVTLLQQLKEIPEVREELVAEMVTKLSDGYFSTRESAEKTAEAILGIQSRE